MKHIGEAAVRELNSLAAAGQLTPETVLTRAQNESSALHSFFTWDDAKAGHLRRLDEARGVIMSVRVKMEVRPDEPPISVRAFVSLADDRLDHGGYRSITAVMSNPSQRGQLLRTALQELNALRRKYAHLSELAQVFDAMAGVEPQKRTGS